MCVMSVVIDQYTDRWTTSPYKFYPSTDTTTTITTKVIDAELEAEIAEFREILERAREWDKAHGQEGCEMDEKIDKLFAVAEELGIADQIKIMIKDE